MSDTTVTTPATPVEPITPPTPATVYILTAVWGTTTEVVGVFTTPENLNDFMAHKSAKSVTGCSYAEYELPFAAMLDRGWK